MHVVWHFYSNIVFSFKFLLTKFSFPPSLHLNSLTSPSLRSTSFFLSTPFPSSYFTSFSSSPCSSHASFPDYSLPPSPFPFSPSKTPPFFLLLFFFFFPLQGGFSEGTTIQGYKVRARFGFSMAALNDVNQDGYNGNVLGF